MSKNILDLIVPELQKTPDFFIHVKKLWLELSDEKTPNLPPFEEFSVLLQKDERFVVEDSQQAPWESDPESIEEMEELGYYTGPRVRLKSRNPSNEDMARIISKHTQKLIDSLVKAYETRPNKISEEDEKQLIQTMVKAKKLKEDIDKALKTENEPIKENNNEKKST